MKSIYVFVLIIVTTSSNPQFDSNWHEYKSSYKKTYRSLGEEQKRYDLFLKKLQEINEHNQKYEQGLSTYKKGINQFSDWTPGEISTLLNRNKIENFPREKNRTIFHTPKTVKAPTKVDWRVKGAVTRVTNQGPICNACWAFSVTGALEGIVKILHNKLIPLSEQNLVDCARPKGCLGGHVEDAFNYVKKFGIEREQDYPYTEVEGQCRFDKTKSVVSVRTYIVINKGDENALKFAVARQPISVALDANQDFIDYESGILDGGKCSSLSVDLNHDALAIGYGTENGVDYWLIKNSWGVEWGDQGYARLVRNQKNRCGIATEAQYPKIKRFL